MNNDIAVFIDLDNVAIGASEANVKFDVQLLLRHIQEITEGRIVLRKAYADWRQHHHFPKSLAAAGFELQSTVNFMDKNLADMQMVVDAMETLVDGHDFATYILVTGDRDFMPLVQSLRKRGKEVIGIGIRHTSSSSLKSLVDRYIYYEDLVGKDVIAITPKAKPLEGKALLKKAVNDLLRGNERVAASVVKQKMDNLSQGNFSKTPGGKKSFKKFIRQYEDVAAVYTEKSTVFVQLPNTPIPQIAQASLPASPPPSTDSPVSVSQPPPNSRKPLPLHKQYRALLKKQGLRVVPASARLLVLREIIELLTDSKPIQWRYITQQVYDRTIDTPDQNISKSYVNDILHVLRFAKVINLQGSGERFSPIAKVTLDLQGPRRFQEAVMRSDAIYLQNITKSELPFDLEEVSMALYDANTHVRYLKVLQQQYGAKAQ